MQVFKLTDPFDPVTRRKVDLSLHCSLRVRDKAREVAVANVGFDSKAAMKVFSRDLPRTFLDPKSCELVEWDQPAMVVRNADFADRVEVVPILGRKPNLDEKATLRWFPARRRSARSPSLR